MDPLLSQKKANCTRNENDAAPTYIRKQVSRSIRKDRRRHQAQMIRKDLDIRDHDIGLEHLRRPYTPIPFSMKDATGKHVPLHRRAQEAANFLGTNIWGHDPSRVIHEPTLDYPVVQGELGMNTADITMEEIMWAIRKLKGGKAAAQT